MLTVRTSENTVITSFRLIRERQDFSSVRTGENTVRTRARIQNGVFHPKIYIFTDHSGQRRVLLGSANFTNGGLQKNEEVLLLLENPDLIDEISDYFEGLWQLAFLFEDADNSYRNLHVRQRSQRVNIEKKSLKTTS